MPKHKILFLFGCVFLCVGGCTKWQSYRIVLQGECVQGYIFEMREHSEELKRKKSPLSRAPVVQFTTKNGESVRYYSNFYTTPPLYAPGDSVKIWYLPANPTEATLDDVTSWLFLTPGVFLVLVAGLLSRPSVQKWLGIFPTD